MINLKSLILKPKELKVKINQETNIHLVNGMCNVNYYFFIPLNLIFIVKI